MALAEAWVGLVFCASRVVRDLRFSSVQTQHNSGLLILRQWRTRVLQQYPEMDTSFGCITSGSACQELTGDDRVFSFLVPLDRDHSCRSVRVLTMFGSPPAGRDILIQILLLIDKTMSCR